MATQLEIEESKIQNSNMTLPDKARALHELYQKSFASPQTPHDWRTPEIAAELRGIVEGIRKAGEAVSTHDRENEQHRAAQAEIRGRIRLLEAPSEVPTPNSASELSQLRCLDEQWTGFLSSADAKRAVAVAQTWGKVQHLGRRLYELTNRDRWKFADRNSNRPEMVHTSAQLEVERILRGEKDSFDVANEHPFTPIIYT